jgi:F0F1-type ATP synthase assembly protein I
MGEIEDIRRSRRGSRHTGAEIDAIIASTGPLSQGSVQKPNEGTPPVADQYSKKEIDQALRIQQLESDSKLSGVEQRLDKRLDTIESSLEKAVLRIEAAVNKMDTKYEERSKSLDWKFNLSIGLLIAILVGAVIVPAFRPKEAATQPAPIIIYGGQATPQPGVTAVPARPNPNQ